MSTAMTIPQLAMPPAPAARAVESAPADPPATTSPTDAPGAPPSFADVLKAKSAARSEDTSEEAPLRMATEDAALLAFMAGVTVPPEAPSAPRLLAQLKGDRSEGLPAALPDAAQTPLSTPAPAADATAGTAITISTDAAASLPPATPVTAAPIAVPSAVPAGLPAVAVPPAPTLTSSRTPASGQTTPMVAAAATNSSAEPVVGLPSRQAALAGTTAKSAESGVPASDPAAPEAARDFRPLLERMAEPAGTNASPAAQVSAPPAPQQPVAAVQVRLATPFAATGWAQEVDQKLSWIVTTARQQADLVLTPPDLGRIEVTLVVKGDEVNASFASPHQAVREAIEESLIRLRETLAESGINLGQTHVGRESSRDAPIFRPEGETRQARGQRQEAVIAPAPGRAWTPASGRGMVDVFA